MILLLGDVRSEKMKAEFVDRKRELDYLRKNAGEIKRGRGKVILIEGSAGIGKTALLNEFEKEVKKDFEILKGKCTQDSKYVPYDLFSQALKNYGTLKNIKVEEEKRKIKDIAEDLIVRPKMVFIDEISGGGGYQLYRAIRKEIGGVYFSVNPPERKDGIWLTETKTEKRSAEPSNIEFSIVPLIYDVAKDNKMKVFYIDKINYLIYINGIDRVVEFLHTLYSFSSDKHIVLISGKTEYLTEEERSTLLSSFDEEISIEWEEKRKKNLVYLVNESKEGVVFTSKKGEGKYTVGRGYIEPHRIDFELFDRIADEIMRGNNIVLDCIPLLIHYNNIRKIYIWLKAVADFARKHNVKLYITTRGLNNAQIDMLRDIADVSEIVRHVEYEEMEKEQSIKFYDTIFSFLDYNSKKRPIIILLEDLQWSDKSSLELLHYLSRNIIRSRIMIIVTYRNEDIVFDEKTSEIIEEIQNLENSDLIRIKPLSKKDLRKIFSDMNDETFEAIYEKSEGNPLLAITISNNIGEGKIIMPESIRESIEMQIDSLDDRTLYFLRFLSILGEKADVNTIKKFYPDYPKYIEKLKNKFLESENGKIGFIYSPYRDVVYQEISKDLRINMHRKIGEFMKKRGDVIKAAYHYYMAGERKSLELLKKVAEESISVFAIRDAIDYYGKALDIAKKYNLKDEIYRIYEKIGDYYMLLGEYKNAIEMYKNSLKNGNPNEVNVGIKIGKCNSSLGKYDLSIDIFKRYLEKAKGIEKAKIIGQIGIVNWHIGNFDKALSNLEEYLKLAKKYKSKEDVAEAYRNIAIVYYYKSDYEKTLEYAKKALNVSSEISDYGKIANSYNVIGVVYERMYKLDDALEYFRKYLEISEKIGNFDYISKAYNNMAIVYDVKGDVEKVKDYYLKSLEFNFKIGNKRELSISYNNLAIVETEMGDYLKALEYMKKSTKYADESGDIYEICRNYRNMASMYIDLKYYDEAETYIKKAMRIADEENYETEKISNYLIYVSLLIGKKDYKKAGEYLKKAEKLVKEEKDKSIKLSYLETEIEYYIEVKNINAAEDSLKIAMDIADDIGNEYEIMYALQYLAKLRCMRNDINSAIRYYDEIISYFKKIGKEKILADILFDFGKCLSKYNKKECIEKLNSSKMIYRKMNLLKKEKEVEMEILKMEKL